MLTHLRQQNVIADEVVKMIDDIEYENDKPIAFIEFLIKNGTKIQILKFCKQLRAQGQPSGHLPDLIEGKNTDGRDTVDEIKEHEEIRLKEVSREHLTAEENSNETCEAVHIYVEEKLGCDVEFSVLNGVIGSLFGCTEKDGRYEGISIATKIDDDDKKEDRLDDEVNVAALSFEEYAEYIGRNFRSIGEDVCEKITNAIKKEAVQMETFVEFTEDDLNECFGHYLGCTHLPFGTRKKLQLLQTHIKSHVKSTTKTAKMEGSLRQFDKPCLQKYEKCEVSYCLGGDQNVPAHEFVQPVSSRLTKHLIVKKTIRFISACLNARKNGTIHFGIKRTGRNKGEIIGCENTAVITSADAIIVNGIARCFGHLNTCLQRNIARCTRPVHIIHVSNKHSVVAEIDIVPFGKHLSDSFYTAMFPPNGPQKEVFFLYEVGPNCDIVEIERGRVEAVQIELKDAIRERHMLDAETLSHYRSASDLVQHLTYELTRGAEYVTEIFYPIICTGKMETTDFLDYHGFQDAFQNSYAVFDFGSSRKLRKKMEDGSPLFTVKSATDFDIDEKDISFSDKDKLWIYCNGNDELGISELDADTWTDQRMIPLENVMRYMKKKIPPLRAKVLFLVFGATDLKDPMVEFAREAFIRIFKHQCIIIGETPDVLEAFNSEISRKIGQEKINSSLFSGLSWFEISKVFRKTFKESSDNICKLPNSSGTYEELTQKEKEKWKYIDILSMEECVHDEKQMKPDEQKIKQKEEETKFYQGKKASWWNFYYGHHGERDLFSKLRFSIEKKLTRTDGKMLVESVEVRHEPGAGGSILGRHLIWHFSQTRCINEPYRCCVVKEITENTVEEIEKFRQYKDSTPRPVIILLDDEPDGNMFFQKGLHQLAYKTASPGELFGIVINVSRVALANDPVEEAENGKIVVKNTVKHRLTDRERAWFEKKYKELEKSDVDVNTLIAFNVMRNSFDKEYIKSTVEQIMKEVSPTELDILKVLSLICTYEIGTLVPESTFDSIVGIPITTKQNKIGDGKPYGMRRKQVPIKIRRLPEILNSESLSLFACRSGYELRNRGLRIISQPLAEVILRYIQETQTLSLEDIVMFILSQTQHHCSKDNYESTRFVEVVCSLFKTREDSGKGRDGVKDKFSRLIFAFFDERNTNDIEEGKASVVRVMSKCITITGDAFVGQQLARFHIIHTKDFTAAEQAICESIDICQNNSYLLDTYGQVFKTNMEYIKEKNCQGGKKISDDHAKEVISLAYNAIDKFTEGQITNQEYEKDKCNLSCYFMEVRTLVGLLEIFELFECYTNEDDLLDILTNPDRDINGSFLSDLNKNGSIDQIIQGGKRQVHVADALRFVEERDYQVKKIYTIYTAEDVLLLSLRERYERFYRSHGLKYQLKFGYGLKPLMRAFKSKERPLVESRYLEAKRNLERLPLEYADTRDLLFFIGYSFMELLTTGSIIDERLYRQLLSYSAKLLDTQTQKDVKRPYLEAFLFYSFFHWPLKSRFKYSNLSSPNTYISLMEKWEQTYLKNNYIANREQMKANKGKTYFALSKDLLGVLDLFEIEMEWREKKEKEEGRSRMHVYKDYFWREPFVADQLKRLTGTLDDSGTVIKHMVQYPKGNHLFKIKAFYPSAQLRNREVTFVLAFTWSGLRAFDVVEKCEELSGSGGDDNVDTPEESEATVHVKPREIDYTLYQRKSSPTNDISNRSRKAHSRREGSSNSEGESKNAKPSTRSEVWSASFPLEHSHNSRDAARCSIQDSIHKLPWNEKTKEEHYITDTQPQLKTSWSDQPSDIPAKAQSSVIRGVVVTSVKISSTNEPDNFLENGNRDNRSSNSKQHMDYATVASKGTTRQVHQLSERQFPASSFPRETVRPKEPSEQFGSFKEKPDAALHDMSQDSEYWEKLQKEGIYIFTRIHTYFRSDVKDQYSWNISNDRTSCQNQKDLQKIV
ncbi:sterile alpha motif domain-containing protein 9-like [Mercenaria mercenaria]|uniref:sterile alpha motif domain-containing protein 9-like n=1 Tax=Mercenaria mercenaria TaxID=6596 RepID=UPI00234F3FD2|nr:sterile alpha motif domain-containing protein 9-like [Mercenaria mercenaria]